MGNIINQVDKTLGQKFLDFIKKEGAGIVTDMFTGSVGGAGLQKATRLFEVLTVDRVTENALDPAENGLYYIDIA